MTIAIKPSKGFCGGKTFSTFQAVKFWHRRVYRLYGFPFLNSGRNCNTSGRSLWLAPGSRGTLITLMVAGLVNCVGLVVIAHTSQWSIAHTSLYNAGTLLTFHPLDGTGRCSLGKRSIVQVLYSQSDLHVLAHPC